MAKIIVNEEISLNGRVTVKRELNDENKLLIYGSLATHFYLEEIKSIKTERFILSGVEVYEEVFATDDFDILYNFKARSLKINGISNLEINEIKEIEKKIYNSNNYLLNSSMDVEGGNK